jgi:hypothetical protein
MSFLEIITHLICNILQGTSQESWRVGELESWRVPFPISLQIYHEHCTLEFLVPFTY